MEPAPSSNAFAGLRFPSASVTVASCTDEVIRADLICPGVQLGCTALTRAETPAECGLDMDVPAMIWNRWPGGPEATSMGRGVLPARIWMPGAVTSGLRKSVEGPREENDVTWSPWMCVATPVSHDARTA